MPGKKRSPSRKKRPVAPVRSRRPPSRPARARQPSPSQNLSRDLFETLELLGDAFEEAVGHVLKRPGSPLLLAGPRLPLPLSRLVTGYVGWQVELRGEPTAVPSLSRGVLYLLASPSPVGPSMPRTGESPVQAVRWNAVHALELASAGARLLLLAAPHDSSDLPRFRTLAEDIRAEFRPDQD